MTTTRPSRLARIATVSALALAVTGGAAACDSGTGPAPDVAVKNAAAAASRQTAEPMKRSEPTRLQIPSAGVDTGPILHLDVDGTGELGVPPEGQADKAGWFTQGVTPGEQGPAVLVAHYDTAKGPALMKDVKNIKVGELIKVGRKDGSTATFKIREIEQVDKKKFPTEKVYGNTDRAELRLLTCGGPIVNGHRSANIIFYADLTAT